METLLRSLENSYVAFVANIGLLALLALAVMLLGGKIFVQNDRPSVRIQIILGVLFGTAAALLMNIPVEIEPGIFGDTRGAPLLLAGVVGGPVSAVFAATLAGAMRLHLGGDGAAMGAVYAAIFALAGVVWRHICERTALAGTGPDSALSPW